MKDAYQQDARAAGHKTAGPFWAAVGARWSGRMRALFHLPRAAASRILILLVVLALVKLALLAGSGKHLHEIHWRVGGIPAGWVGYAALWAFVGIGVWSLLAMGRHCQSVGLRAVRAANAVVLGLALLFIFLTFHEGPKNYLYPVMTGTLGWKDLGPYLSLDFFFRKPFLAAWIFGYALLYYFFARTNREGWVLHLTALFAGAYGLLCLRELVDYRDELAVAGCFGFASVLFLRRSDTKLHAAWLLVPMAWTLFAWGLFYFQESSLRNLNPYFLLLAGASVTLFGAATLLAKSRGFYAAWIKGVPFFFVAFFLLSSAHYPTAENYNNLLCYAFQFPNYFVGRSEEHTSELQSRSGISS